LELLPELEAICNLYDSFVKSKSFNSAAQARFLELDFEALHFHYGRPNHEIISRLVSSPRKNEPQQPSAHAVHPSPQSTNVPLLEQQRANAAPSNPQSRPTPEQQVPVAVNKQMPPVARNATFAVEVKDGMPDKERFQKRNQQTNIQPNATSDVTRNSVNYFALQIGVNYSDSDQPIGSVVGNFSSMLRFWADRGVAFSQHVLCSDELDHAKRLGPHVLKGVTLEEMYSAMQEVSEAMSRSADQQNFLYLHVVSLTTDAPKPRVGGSRGAAEQFGQAIVPCDHEDSGYLFVDDIAAWLGTLPRHCCFAVFDTLQSDPVSTMLLPVPSGTIVSGCHEDVQLVARAPAGVNCQNVTAALLSALNGVDDLTESQLKSALAKAVRSGVPEVTCSSPTVLHGWSRSSAEVASVPSARFASLQNTQPPLASVRSRASGSGLRGQEDPNARPAASRFDAGSQPAPAQSRMTPAAPSNVASALPNGKVSPVFIRRDASTRFASDVDSSSVRSATPKTSASSAVPAASINSTTNIVSAASKFLSLRNRKSYLSDDSSPENPRFVAGDSNGRFPSIAPSVRFSGTNADESSARISGVSSPIRRRVVPALGHVLALHHSHQGPGIDPAATHHSAYRPCCNSSFCLFFYIPCHTEFRLSF
jgi:hypothetical protein